MILTLCHGFNLTPSKMLSLSKAIQKSLPDKKIIINNIVLTNHESQIAQKKIDWKIWANDVIKQSKLIEVSDSTPHYFLGYSLGGLAGLMAQSITQKKFHKQIFIATPFYFNSPLIGLLRMAKFIRSPQRSFIANHHYRAQKLMNGSSYQSVFKMRSQFLKAFNQDKNFFNIPTLLINDPLDEIVDVKRVNKWLIDHKNSLTRWRSTEFQTHPMHHLLIDPFGLGTENQWENFISQIQAFLTA
ncbi:MAG: hypothetical protein QE271_04740 [Bacteriovoracaceae bacterium]|nr:hypothetical protein [Bacteriovoracaceae bacterium]